MSNAYTSYSLSDRTLTFTDANGQAVTQITYPTRSSIIDAQQASSLVFGGVVDVDTPSAAVMASASKVLNGALGLKFQKTNHGFYTGLIVQFTTSDALPTGISTSTDYYVIRADANNFYVADTLAHALANTAIAYTDAGTGDQTATPTSAASEALVLQGSYDQSYWYNVPNESLTISADGTLISEVDYIRYPFYALYATLASGMMTFTSLQVGVKTSSEG